MRYVKGSGGRDEGERKIERGEGRGEGRGKNTNVPYTLFVTMETE